ncbi:MAG TPA: DnaJ domain-containing protein [Myxococcota bacterium]|nr:DnaJ domain-containing protein [Myxococcota bacterium]HRY93367.1 DnaJ domain-containing protein [Myxococcota bacterium]HSA23214.1 DnaJ domain-containing protein [Myxococcota bacterium]
MQTRDFYVVLGVSRDADPGEIKTAYRRLVKLYHPDAAPCAPVDKFIEVQDAYDCLSDPETRGQHDQALEGSGAQAGDRVRVKKRAATRAREVPRGEPPGPSVWSELDDFFAGWVPGVFGAGPDAAREKDLYAELVLSRQEARAGGMLPLQIPVEQGCAECRGTLAGPVGCPVCHGRGRVVDYHTIEVSVPPGVDDGTLARIPLTDLGLRKVSLLLLVSIQP